MAWDPVWEQVFRSGRRWNKYPPEELVRFFALNFYPVADRCGIKCLEVGCGPGGGPSWYIAREGFSFYGIDGSETAIELAKKRFDEERLQGSFAVGSADDLPYHTEFFDCVIDIACLQHNSETDCRRIVSEIHRVSKRGARHFSLTAKCGCWGDGAGTRIDSTTFSEITEGPFARMGIMRFATRDSLADIYSDFRNVEINHSIRSMSNGQKEIADWILTCEK